MKVFAVALFIWPEMNSETKLDVKTTKNQSIGGVSWEKAAHGTYQAQYKPLPPEITLHVDNFSTKPNISKLR